MEPVCWLGIAGIIGIGAALYGMLTKGSSCSGNTCDCATKKETPVQESTEVNDSSEVKESKTAPVTGIDERKEKAINDLIK